ncbi:flagellar biosynthetic protein FliR, partial [Escherichia coli]|nr:flagellar biosynthetic protein FliR [Escherichia coli]
ILFWAIDAAGQIIDTLRGSTISAIFNPSISDSASITGGILYQFITVIFVIHGGIQSVLDKLYLSYEILPLQADIAFNRALVDFLFSL